MPRPRLASIFAGVSATAVAIFIMIAVGGIAVLGTLLGTAAVVVSAPVLWLRGKPRSAGKLLAGWAVGLAGYVLISTGIGLVELRHEHPRAIGQEVCADSGCFGVDKVDRKIVGAENSVFTLFWHLASTDGEKTKRFPGRGLEIFLFDNNGRKFPLAANVDPNPLDVLVPGGGTVRQSLQFTVPSNTQALFLTAQYRPFTFQSLLPGAISLVPHRPPAMIRIQ